jgi:hypothetical protein
MGINIPFHAEHLLTDRDPATYTVAGVWLTEHNGLHIPKPTGIDNLPGINTESLGFGTSALNPHELYAQGSHLLPALLGVAGKLFGRQAVFSANVVFGGVALLAFYGFTRHLLQPRWAAFATFAFSLSLPLIYFSRDAYTEPLALAAMFTALTWLHRATRSHIYMDWLVAGLAIGTTVLIRPDAYITVAAFEAFFVIYIARSTLLAKLRAIRQTLVCAFPIGACMLLGWTDLSQLSSGYYHDLHKEILAQVFLVLGIAVVAVPALALHKLVRHTIAMRVVHTHIFRMVVVASMASFFLFLFVRAAYLFMQASRGKLDTMPVQTYSNHTTLLWLLWYISPVLAFVGIIRFIVVWRKVLHGKTDIWLPLLLVLSADCALYLLNPRITPDQVWASRRFLPVIFPSFTILGAAGLQHLHVWRAHRPWLPKRYKLPIALAGTAALLAIVITSLPFWTMHPFAQSAAIEHLCQTHPTNALIVWVGSEGGFATEPTSVMCHAVSLSTTATGAQLTALLPHLQQIATAQHRQLYIGVNASEANLLPEGTRYLTHITLTYADPEHTYKKFSRRQETITQQIALYR